MSPSRRGFPQPISHSLLKQKKLFSILAPRISFSKHFPLWQYFIYLSIYLLSVSTTGIKARKHMDHTCHVLCYTTSIWHSAGLVARTKYVPAFVLNLGNTAVNETDKNPSPHGANTLLVI